MPDRGGTVHESADMKDSLDKKKTDEEVFEHFPCIFFSPNFKI